MKLQPDKADVQILTAHGPGWVAINGERVESSVIVGSRDERQAWNCRSFDALGAQDFLSVAGLAPEVVIFGSGDRIRFPRPAWIAPLIERGIGVETMDTAAACRTYNILAGEGRHVVAALLIETPVSSS